MKNQLSHTQNCIYIALFSVLIIGLLPVSCLSLVTFSKSNLGCSFRQYVYLRRPLSDCSFSLQLLILPSSYVEKGFSFQVFSHETEMAVNDNSKMQSDQSIPGIDTVNDDRSMRHRRLKRRKMGSNLSLNTESSVFRTSSDPKTYLSLNPNEDAPAFIVPEHYRADEEDIHNHVNFYGFADIFPANGIGANISELFDISSTFRTSIRMAIRNDLYTYDKSLSSDINKLINDPSSSFMSSWTSKREYPHLTEAFRSHDIPISGEEFIKNITTLIPRTKHMFGSFMDIIGVPNRKISHSWHQDSGLEQSTVMIGFPKEDKYMGIGVFSHCLKLSHKWLLPENVIRAGTEPRLLPKDIDLDESLIVRPLYRKGKEIMVYDDRYIFHSAPDFTYRDSIFRFM